LDLDARIAALEAELVSLRQARADRADAAFLLLLERDVTPGVVFSAADLLAHGRLHPELANAIGHVTSAALGRRLTRVARRAVLSDLTVEKCGRDNRGCIFVLRSTR
jgi:hypothetical protein